MDILLLKTTPSKAAFLDLRDNTYFHLCSTADIGEDDICRAECKNIINPTDPELAREYYNCSRVAARLGPLTLAVTGDAMGITRERVRQLESKAMRVMRSAFNKQMREANFNEVRELFER